MNVRKCDESSVLLEYTHHLIQESPLHRFGKDGPRQPRNDAIDGVDGRRIADSSHILDAVLKHRSSGMARSERSRET
jgi:hypothetical protein